MEEALKICDGKKTVLYNATSSNLERMGDLAKQFGCSIVATAQDLDELSELTGKLEGIGVKNIILDLKPKSLKQTFHSLTIIRRAAIINKNKNLGYPVMSFPKDEVEATIHILKYSSLIVIDFFDYEILDVLFTLRQAIYADPQKPLQVEPKIYEFNNPGKKSPVLITTNFSLTYFTVSADIESTKMPCYLLIVETEGQSVLTGFASGKFSVSSITSALNSTNIMKLVEHKKVVIPGLVSMLKGELEEATGLDVIIGPRNSSELKEYLPKIIGDDV